MIGLVLVLALVGFLVYLVANEIPMPRIFKVAIYVVVAICMIYYLMQVFNIQDIPLPGRKH